MTRGSTRTTPSSRPLPVLGPVRPWKWPSSPRTASRTLTSGTPLMSCCFSTPTPTSSMWWTPCAPATPSLSAARQAQGRPRLPSTPSAPWWTKERPSWWWATAEPALAKSGASWRRWAWSPSCLPCPVRRRPCSSRASWCAPLSGMRSRFSPSSTTCTPRWRSTGMPSWTTWRRSTTSASGGAARPIRPCSRWPS
ncbi:hypothetical protein D9M72_529320 [compost metagenome]